MEDFYALPHPINSKSENVSKSLTDKMKRSFPLIILSLLLLFSFGVQAQVAPVIDLDGSTPGSDYALNYNQYMVAIGKSVSVTDAKGPENIASMIELLNGATTTNPFNSGTLPDSDRTSDKTACLAKPCLFLTGEKNEENDLKICSAQTVVTDGLSDSI